MRLYGPNGSPGTLGVPPIAINTQGAKLPILPALQSITTASEAIILNPGVAATALLLQIPGTTVGFSGAGLEQRRFLVLGSGYITVAGAYSALLRLYANPTVAAGTGGTSLGNSGALTMAAAGTYPFWFKFALSYDSVGGRLQGTSKFSIANQYVAEAALSNVITGISNKSNPVLSLVLGCTFGTANAGNAINVQEFGIYD